MFFARAFEQEEDPAIGVRRHFRPPRDLSGREPMAPPASVIRSPGLQTATESRAPRLHLCHNHASARRSFDAEFLEGIGAGVAEGEPG